MGTVLPNGDCQLYCIWNQLNLKLLDLPVGNFLFRIFETRAVTHLGHTFWWLPAWKHMEEGNCCLPLALALVVSPSVYCYNAPSPILEPTSLEFQCRLKTGSFSESSKLSASGCNCWDIQPRRLNDDHIPPLSTVSQQLLYYLEYML